MSGLTLTVKKSKSLMPKIKAAFDDYEVEAGVFETAGKYPKNGETVAEVAAYNEYGTPKIPERPAFRTSFAVNRKKYLKELIAITKSGFSKQSIKKAMFEALGITAKGDIERSIVGGNWVANAESTQLKKGGGKQKINDPLIDTGLLADSIDYRVTKK